MILNIKLIDLYKKSLHHNNNSAKYVLGLSMLMLRPNSREINLEDIAEKAIEIYYRNIFQYNLIEHNKNQVPYIQQEIEKIYMRDSNRFLTDKDKQELVKIVVSNKNKGFFKYVLPCFTGAKKDSKGRYIYPLKGENEFFSYDLNLGKMELTEHFYELILKKYYQLKCITIEEYISYLQKRNHKNGNIEQIINYY